MPRISVRHFTLVLTAAIAVAVPATRLVAIGGRQPLASSVLAVTAGGASPERTPTVASATPWGMRVLDRHITWRDVSSSLTGAPAVQARGGILVDIDTGEILWERSPHVALPPASTTKVMTALVALENTAPDTLVTITPDALTQQSDETRMGLHAGERLTVRELLSGMLLVSGNDAATSLAVDTVGMDRFVATMNAQESALGLHDSHFTTPVGLDDPGHTISPYDLAAIAAVDVDVFPVLRDIVSQPHIQLAASVLHPTYDLWNLNQLLSLYPAAIGVKPGFTGGAGPCLVGMAERDGHRLISVLMNSPYAAHQSAQLLDWGFAVSDGLPRLLPTPRAIRTNTPSATPAARR